MAYQGPTMVDEHTPDTADVAGTADAADTDVTGTADADRPALSVVVPDTIGSAQTPTTSDEGEDQPSGADDGQTLDVPAFLAAARAVSAQTDVITSVRPAALDNDLAARERLTTSHRRLTRKLTDAIPDVLFQQYRDTVAPVPRGRTPTALELRSAYAGLTSYCQSVFDMLQSQGPRPAAEAPAEPQGRPAASGAAPPSAPGLSGYL